MAALARYGFFADFQEIPASRLTHSWPRVVDNSQIEATARFL
jgi:hypothetical protein